jgi:rsbT co-antagonist protein RsbR
MKTVASDSAIPELIRKHEAALLGEWAEQQSRMFSRQGLISEGQLREDSRRLLTLLGQALGQGAGDDLGAREWNEVRTTLSDLSRSRVEKGFSASETAMFVLSLKRPLFARLWSELADDPQRFADETWRATELLDRLGLYTTEVFQKSREEIISRQQQEMMEMSTPVTQLWDGVLAVPLIGTLDSARTQVVMESLLSEIVRTGASIAIVDITGVPTVDTLVAQHLLKTVAAARLMGADCIISGIRPQIAQTIVHLGVVLGDVTTKATMADALRLAMERRGMTVVSRRDLKA